MKKFDWGRSDLQKRGEGGGGGLGRLCDPLLISHLQKLQTYSTIQAKTVSTTSKVSSPLSSKSQAELNIQKPATRNTSAACCLSPFTSTPRQLTRWTQRKGSQLLKEFLSWFFSSFCIFSNRPAETLISATIREPAMCAKAHNLVQPRGLAHRPPPSRRRKKAGENAFIFMLNCMFYKRETNKREANNEKRDRRAATGKDYELEQNRAPGHPLKMRSLTNGERHLERRRKAVEACTTSSKPCTFARRNSFGEL